MASISYPPRIIGYIAQNIERDAILHEMASYLNSLGLVKPTYAQSVIDRENRFPTGVPADPIAVAIPHSDRNQVLKTAILVAKTRTGVEFRRIDDPDESVPVSVIFMLAVDSDSGQLDTISRVMELIQAPEITQAIAASEDPQEIQGIVARAFASVPV